MFKLKSIILLSGLMLLCGCFEVIEEVTYKDSESGTYLMTLNASQSKTKLQALMNMDSFMGTKIPQRHDIYRYCSLASLAAGKIKGVSAANYTVDFDKFIFTFTFNFDNTETLNQAINAAAQATASKDNLPYYNVFAFHNQTFQRHQTPNDSIAQLAKDKQDQLKLISGAKATSIYRFAKPVSKISNTHAKISKNKKAVMLQQQITDILTNPALFTNTITF